MSQLCVKRFKVPFKNGATFTPTILRYKLLKYNNNNNHLEQKYLILD